jgi:5-methylcytosine-specific restriction endonuclease McrA
MKDPIKARRYMVKTSLRSQWLRSPERAAALRRDGYSCRECGIKQSKAKGHEVSVQVHHIDGILDWQKTIDDVLASGLFCGAEGLRTLCRECHKKHKVVK